MEPGVNHRLDVLESSYTIMVDEFDELVDRYGSDVIKLTTGQPSIPPPRQIRVTIADKLVKEDMKLYKYPPGFGLPELREAIAEDLNRLGGPKINSDEVVVVAGGQHAMFVAFSSIMENGDEIIITDPCYFGYPSLIRYLGGKIRRVPTLVEEGFKLDIEAIKSAIRKGSTKAIVVADPDNPTGRVLTREEARALAELAVDYKLWLIVDEAYMTLVYEGEKSWPFKYAPDNTIGLYTFSKDPGIPGWRLGYIYARKDLSRKMSLLSRETIYSPPSIAQYLVLEYLVNWNERRSFIEYSKNIYKKRRDAMLKSLKEYIENAVLSKPHGAMFIMADLSHYIKDKRIDSVRLAKILLDRVKVAAVPGSYFGESTIYSLRFSFPGEPVERIIEGVRRIGDLLNTLH
ncbi:MAG: pyridoxal phosphate-dependent aminotransferase [Desulfurococcales archaeon]|nr:pyridoxal phosphate-dependent aminotransferase [Desulfurococcales archaeon]